MSESEEMYLVTIARLAEATGEGPIPLAQLANELSVQPVSVNQMVRKLEETGLLVYLPYKGVELTETGSEQALEILRHHRLWEVFLVEQLGYTPAEAEPLACRLEHALPCEAAERLANFLGQPKVTPSGESIPDSGSTQTFPGDCRLQTLPAGSRGYISRITAGTPERAFLSANRLTPGVEIEVLATGSQGDHLVAPEGSQPIHLSATLCSELWIQVES